MPQVGQSAKCVNFKYGHDDVHHRMRVTYVRGATSMYARIEGVDDGTRNWKPIGYFCFRCKEFWTFGEVRRIYEERNRIDRAKPTMFSRRPINKSQSS
jgi:hypothetical protein